MSDEACQEIGFEFEAVHLIAQFAAEDTGVFGRVVGHAAVLGMVPHLLVGIEFGRVARKLLGGDFGVAGKELSYENRAVMDVAAIPDDRERSRQVSAQVLEKSHGVFGMGIFVVGQEREVQVQFFARGTHRDGADGRDAISPIPGFLDGCLATGRKGAPHRGGQPIPRFVEEHEVRTAPARPLLMRGNSSPTQRVISVSSRSRARRTGF